MDRQSAPAFSPVTAAERLPALDTLRGVAVLGILVMNIYGFAMPTVAYSNPLAWGGSEWHNLATWFVTHVFFDQKFLTLFSMLYGGGLILMATRAEARGARYSVTWYRRSFWLLVLGAIHAYLLWFGDILFHYAVLGMLVFPFHHLAPRTLIKLAAAFLSTGLLVAFASGAVLSTVATEAREIIAMQGAGESLNDEQLALLDTWQDVSEWIRPPAEQAAEDIEAYSGDYAGIVAYRMPTVVLLQTDGLFEFAIWRIGGLMLLGMALMKLGILTGARDDSLYVRMIWIGYGIGLPVVILGAWSLQVHQWDFMWKYRIGQLPNYVGSVLVAFGHMGLIILIARRRLLPRLMDRFAAVGRMALTNYLMHSVILTVAFYGYGFGLYGQVSRAGQMVIVVCVIGLQLWLSPWWLDRFRFGPMEWAWRSLTYWHPQAMRK